MSSYTWIYFWIASIHNQFFGITYCINLFDGIVSKLGGELIKPEIKKIPELFLLEPFDVVYT